MTTQIKKILNKQTKTIISAGSILAIAMFSSRILGLVRDKLLAHKFGASLATDIYNASFRVPDLIFNIIILSTISAGFIPVLTKYLREKDNNKKAWQLVNNLLNTVLLSLIIIIPIMVLTADIWTSWLVPGFDAQAKKLTANLSRIMFISPLLFAISNIFGSVLRVFRRFIVWALCPILYNLGIIIGIIFFTPIWGLYGLAFGVLLGAFAHLIIQIPTIIHIKYKYKFIINLKDQGLRRILKLMLPRALGMSVIQVNILAITILASLIGEGSIAAFSFANNLQGMPIGIFGISFAVAAFPALSRFSAKQEIEKFKNTFAKTMARIMFFAVPAAAFMYILRAQIVRLVFGSGQFDWADTRTTIACLGFFAFGLSAQASISLLARAFYAIENTKIPFITSFIGAIINIILGIYLSPKMGIGGLALAFTIAGIVNMALLFFILRIKLGNLNDKFLFIINAKISFSALIAGLLTHQALYWADPFVNTHTVLGLAIQAVFAGFIGLSTYLILTWIFRCEEVLGFVSWAKKKLG